jgi:hypothetical protein
MLLKHKASTALGVFLSLFGVILFLDSLIWISAFGASLYWLYPVAVIATIVLYWRLLSVYAKHPGRLKRRQVFIFLSLPLLNFVNLLITLPFGPDSLILGIPVIGELVSIFGLTAVYPPASLSFFTLFCYFAFTLFLVRAFKVRKSYSSCPVCTGTVQVGQGFCGACGSNLNAQ